MRDANSVWYLQLPSQILAAFIVLLLLRLLLSPFLRPGNVIQRVLAAVTDPVVKTVAAITPRIAPLPVQMGITIIWLLTARIVLHQAMLLRRMFG